MRNYITLYTKFGFEESIKMLDGVFSCVLLDLREINDSVAWAIASKPAADFSLNGLLIIRFENKKK